MNLRLTSILMPSLVLLLSAAACGPAPTPKVDSVATAVAQAAADLLTGTAAAARGRRPTLLRVRTSGRLAVAVDVRPGWTSIALADFGGQVLSRDGFATPERPEALANELATRVNAVLRSHPSECQGIGIVVPGMVDRRTGRVLYAPRLGWRNAHVTDVIVDQTTLPVYVESAPIACALARLWSLTGKTRAVNNFAYVSISDGVGVGIVNRGEVLRGETQTAGELGHVSTRLAVPHRLTRISQTNDG